MKQRYILTTMAIACLMILASCATSVGADKMPAAEGQWLTSFDAAIAEARKTGKPVMANFTGSHTDPWGYPWCWKLNEEVFKKSEFKEWAKKNVVPLLLTFPATEPQDEATQMANAALARKYGVEEYPTTIFLAQDGEPLGVIGYVRGGASVWIKEAEDILATKK